MMDALQQAVQLLQAGRADEAEAVLDRVLAQTPDQPDALHLRGMARGRLGRFEAGAADLERAAGLHPQPHAVWSNLGNLRRRAGDPVAAIEAYRQALQLMPGFVDARFNLGVALYESGEADAAREAFEGVLAAMPQHAGALNGLGNLSSRAGELDRAVDFYAKAVAAAPSVTQFRINHAATLRNTRRADESLRHIDIVCRQAPDLAEAHYQRGHTLRMLGRTSEAHNAYRRAIDLAPLRTDIHKDLANLLWEMGRGSNAAAAMREVLSRTPSAELFEALGQFELLSGQPEAAAVAFAAALEQEPQRASAMSRLGVAQLHTGEGERGLQSLRQALTVSGGRDFAIRHSLAEACLSAGLVEEAVAVLDADPPPEHLQKHVALQATAWRCAGDQRYLQFYDYDRFTEKRRISTPPGYASLDAFNADLSACIARLHATEAHPIEQTLFGGTQSPGRLWNSDEPVIQALAGALMEAAQAFVADLPDDPEHPFLARKSAQLELAGAWSVRLRSGGGHVDHYHPAGWISASYYVQVPESVMAGERAGWLRLGAPGIAGLHLPAERYIKPEPGTAIFFPSYMWHGVEPFESDEIRVTAPFDLLPV